MFWWGLLAGLPLAPAGYFIGHFAAGSIGRGLRRRRARRRLVARGFNPVTAAYFARIAVALDVDPDLIVDSSHNHWSDAAP